jgi:hypothetical protein
MSARQRSSGARGWVRAAVVTALVLLSINSVAGAQDLAVTARVANDTIASDDGLAGSLDDEGARAQRQNPRQPPRQPSPPAPPPQRPATTTTAPREPAIALGGIAEIGFVAFQATQSLEAVYDTSGGLIWGGGIQIAHRRGLFGQVTAYRYAASGQRAFVSNGDVFPLGIASDLTVVPIDFTAGWRFVPRPRTTVPPRPVPPPRGTPPPPPPRPGTPPPRGSAPPPTTSRPSRFRLIPYVAGGVGVVRVTERGDFGESDDDVEVNKTTYHVRGGVEFPLAGRWLGGGVDAGWRWAPDVLVGSGVAQEFDETALDHFFVAFRVTIGR